MVATPLVSSQPIVPTLFGANGDTVTFSGSVKLPVKRVGDSTAQPAPKPQPAPPTAETAPASSKGKKVKGLKKPDKPQKASKAKPFEAKAYLKTVRSDAKDALTKLSPLIKAIERQYNVTLEPHMLWLRTYNPNHFDDLHKKLRGGKDNELLLREQEMVTTYAEATGQTPEVPAQKETDSNTDDDLTDEAATSSSEDTTTNDEEPTYNQRIYIYQLKNPIEHKQFKEADFDTLALREEVPEIVEKHGLSNNQPTIDGISFIVHPQDAWKKANRSNAEKLDAIRADLNRRFQLWQRSQSGLPSQILSADTPANKPISITPFPWVDEKEFESYQKDRHYQYRNRDQDTDGQLLLEPRFTTSRRGQKLATKKGSKKGNAPKPLPPGFMMGLCEQSIIPKNELNELREARVKKQDDEQDSPAQGQRYNRHNDDYDDNF